MLFIITDKKDQGIRLNDEEALWLGQLVFASLVQELHFDVNFLLKEEAVHKVHRGIIDGLKELIGDFKERRW